MFILIANEGKRRIGSVPTSENEIIYLYKDNIQKFPLLSLLDKYSHTFFNVDYMEQLISELNLAKAEDETKTMWEQQKNECLTLIARLEIKSNNVYDRKHARAIENRRQLIETKQRFREMEEGKLMSQLFFEISEHLDDIISLAQQCREYQCSTLIHTPFE